MGPFTTFRIGGPAHLFYRASSVPELAEARNVARDLEIPTFLLGKGANIMLADARFRGRVARSEAGGIEFLDDRRVRTGAGVAVLPDLIGATAARGC